MLADADAAESCTAQHSANTNYRKSSGRTNAKLETDVRRSKPEVADPKQRPERYVLASEMK